MTTERGPYLTPNRALSLERRISESEGRLGERIAQLHQELEKERARTDRVLRGLINAIAGLKGEAQE